MTTSTSIKDQLRKLVDLQSVDAQAFDLKRILKEKPAEVEVLRQEFESKKVTLKQLEEKLKTLQVAQKSLDLDLKQKEEGIVKAEGTLAVLKTNKEYQARLLEIESIKADKSVIEEKILESYDVIEAAKKEIDTEKAIVATYERDFTMKKKNVDDEVAVAQDQLKVKESLRARLLPEVRPDILAKYDRILNNKDGLAVVPVNNQACGGCYMHLTEQLMNEMHKYMHLTHCDSCARILYFVDEL